MTDRIKSKRLLSSHNHCWDPILKCWEDKGCSDFAQSVLYNGACAPTACHLYLHGYFSAASWGEVEANRVVGPFQREAGTDSIMHVIPFGIPGKRRLILKPGGIKRQNHLGMAHMYNCSSHYRCLIPSHAWLAIVLLLDNVLTLYVTSTFIFS